MFEVRQILVRMRQGGSDRVLSRAGLVGGRKAADIRRIAKANNCLDTSIPLSGNKVLSQSLDSAPVSPSVGNQSSVEPYREQVKTWVDQAIQSTTIHQALMRHDQFTGSYSAVHRFVRSLCEIVTPKSTVKLDFAPSEAAQVDFGTGPVYQCMHRQADQELVLPDDTGLFSSSVC